MSILKLDNDADHFAMLQAVGLDSGSMPELICRLAALAGPSEDFEIVIRLLLLPYSYQINTSFLGKNAFVKFSSFAEAADLPPFDSYITYKVGRLHAAILFLRSPGPRSHHLPIGRQSLVALIKDWLLSDKTLPLEVPKSHICKAFQIRPEQAVYRVFKETGQRVALRRFANHFRITLPQ